MDRDALVALSNEIYTKAHNYYNTRARLTDAFTAAGLPASPTQGEINQLTMSQVRILKVAVLQVVIDALRLGTIEDKVEYPSIMDAVDDLQNQVPDVAERMIISTNLIEFGALLDALATITDKNLVMTQITGSKGVVDDLEGRINNFDLMQEPIP